MKGFRQLLGASVGYKVVAGGSNGIAMPRPGTAEGRRATSNDVFVTPKPGGNNFESAFFPPQTPFTVRAGKTPGRHNKSVFIKERPSSDDSSRSIEETLLDAIREGTPLILKMDRKPEESFVLEDLEVGHHDICGDIGIVCIDEIKSDDTNFSIKHYARFEAESFQVVPVVRSSVDVSTDVIQAFLKQNLMEGEYSFTVKTESGRSSFVEGQSMTVQGEKQTLLSDLQSHIKDDWTRFQENYLTTLDSMSCPDSVKEMIINWFLENDPRAVSLLDQTIVANEKGWVASCFSVPKSQFECDLMTYYGTTISKSSHTRKGKKLKAVTESYDFRLNEFRATVTECFDMKALRKALIKSYFGQAQLDDAPFPNLLKGVNLTVDPSVELNKVLSTIPFNLKRQRKNFKDLLPIAINVFREYHRYFKKYSSLRVDDFNEKASQLQVLLMDIKALLLDSEMSCYAVPKLASKVTADATYIPFETEADVESMLSLFYLMKMQDKTLLSLWLENTFFEYLKNKLFSQSTSNDDESKFLAQGTKRSNQVFERLIKVLCLDFNKNQEGPFFEHDDWLEIKNAFEAALKRGAFTFFRTAVSSLIGASGSEDGLIPSTFILGGDPTQVLSTKEAMKVSSTSGAMFSTEAQARAAKLNEAQQAHFDQKVWPYIEEYVTKGRLPEDSDIPAGFVQTLEKLDLKNLMGRFEAFVDSYLETYLET
ncbi:hypothetical protein DID77_03785 [Candidatus Marinamargulisbacteria bacterium SCGC AG-439-L15]|nr:hypothetical protein DID77_03785 [Candidatus Marinamargulisbacteria bacterium SCGC AG-439-L15]